MLRHKDTRAGTETDRQTVSGQILREGRRREREGRPGQLKLATQLSVEWLSVSFTTDETRSLFFPSRAKVKRTLNARAPVDTDRKIRSRKNDR